MKSAFITIIGQDANGYFGHLHGDASSRCRVTFTEPRRVPAGVTVLGIMCEDGSYRASLPQVRRWRLSPTSGVLQLSYVYIATDEGDCDANWNDAA